LKAYAHYFDGLSSASQKIEIESDERAEDYRLLLSEGGILQWRLEDLTWEHYSGCLELRNRTAPMAMVKINDQAFIDEFILRLRQKDRLGLHQRLMHLGFKKHLMIAAGILLILVMAYFYALPIAAEKAATLLPESFDRQLSAVFLNSFLAENEIDTVRTPLLNEFADHLTMDGKDKIRITVLKAPTVNAFALPDGNIVIYTGILHKIQDYSELAALIGHETAHVHRRHSIKMLCRNMAGYLLISSLMSDVNGIMAIVADNAHNLQSLSYSRRFEQEADEQSVHTLVQNHINPYGITQLFSILEKEERIRLPEIVSTHPLTPERKNHISQYILSVSYQVDKQPVMEELFKKIKK
jgi:predicted Zn-dependent protease